MCTDMDGFGEFSSVAVSRCPVLVRLACAEFGLTLPAWIKLVCLVCFCRLVHEFMKTLLSKGSEPKDKGAHLEVGSVMRLGLKGSATFG